jgi:hypothetical protein
MDLTGMSSVYGGRVAQAWASNVMVDENYRVDLDKVECSCNAPQIMHAPCSHMITACRVRGYGYDGLPYMSPLYLRSNTLSIWEKSFELYLEPT